MATGSATGSGAYEGSKGSATASIRSMKRARGIHKGTNGTISSWVTATTNWSK